MRRGRAARLSLKLLAEDAGAEDRRASALGRSAAAGAGGQAKEEEEEEKRSRAPRGAIGMLQPARDGDRAALLVLRREEEEEEGVEAAKTGAASTAGGEVYREADEAMDDAE